MQFFFSIGLTDLSYYFRVTKYCIMDETVVMDGVAVQGNLTHGPSIYSSM